MKTRKLKALFLNEEWLIVLIGLVILALIAIFPGFMNNIKMLKVSTLDTATGWINTAYTFVFLFIVIFTLKDISGNSIGKRLLGFAIFSTVTNEKPTIIQLILRNIFFFLLIPFEAFIILFRPDQRRLGDLIAKTKVIKIYK